MSSVRMLEALKVVIASNCLPTLSLIHLSSTTFHLRRFTKDFVADNMLSLDVFDDERLISALVLSEIYQRNPTNFAFIAKVFSNIGFITTKIDYDLETLRSLIRAIKASGYKNNAHYNSVLSNLVYYGNVEILELMLEEDFKLPDKLYAKVQNQLNNQKQNPFIKNNPPYVKTHSILIDDKLRKILEEIILQIKSHEFKLNGGGDSSITEIDHPIPKNAARVYKLAKKHLNSSESLMNHFSEIADLITKKLSASQGKWTTFRGWGERDESTTKLYANIINIVTEGKNIAIAALQYTTQTKKS